MWRLYSYMYVARADSSCILNVYTGFQARVIFFYIKIYREFNTVANLIRLHSYGRRVSRMTDELVNVSRMAE